MSKGDLDQLASAELREEAKAVYRALESARFGGGVAVDRGRVVACMVDLLKEAR